MYVQVQEWKQTHGADLLYFRPATQEEEVLTEDPDDEYIVEEGEDDILYAEGVDAITDDTNTLLFIHQSAEQLHVLKRSEEERELFKIR